ncbi:MAG: hypothetical protein MPN21_04890 [Thermoanaerobaculia bacterium]|nr:hypothetical protein [Thermoanaerobaculia bacterium]
MSRTIRVCLLPLWLTLAPWIAGCSEYESPTAPVEEEVVEVERVTEVFSGDLELGETDCHGFMTSLTGDIDIELADLGPLETLTLGMGIGTPDEAAADGCSFFASDSSVTRSTILQSPSLVAGDYCVCIFDVGNIFPDEVVTYTLDVTHP